MALKFAMEFVAVDGASARVKALANSVRGLSDEGKRAAKSLDQAVVNIGEGVRRMELANELRRQLLDPGIAAAASLQDALAGLRVELDPRSEQEMRDSLRSLGQDAARIAGPTAFSAVEVVGIQTSLKKAGLAEGSVSGAAEGVAQLATGDRSLGLDQATQAVITLGTVFRLTGPQFVEAADLLARAGSAGSTNAAQLSEALSSAGAVGEMGVKTEDALAALVSLSGTMRGSEAGTSMRAFLDRAAVADKKFGIDLFDKQGSFVGLEKAAEVLRAKTAGKSDQDVSLMLQKVFGETATPFARALLRTGEGSFEDSALKMARAASLQDKVAQLAGTANATTEALKGTAESTLATLFTPLLAPLTKATGAANELLNAVNTRAQADEGLAKGVSYGAAGLVGGAGLLGLAQVLRGGGQGLAGLGGILRGGLAGQASTAIGTAKGKALEAAAGVQPVFVVNAAEIGGGLGAAATSAASTAAGAVGKTGKLATAGKVLGAVALAPVAAEIGSAAGRAEGALASSAWEAARGTRLQNATALAMSNMALLSPARLAMSDTGVDAAKRTRSLAWDGLKGQLGLKVDVKVDKSGGAAVEARWDDGGRVAAAMARGG